MLLTMYKINNAEDNSRNGAEYETVTFIRTFWNIFLNYVVLAFYVVDLVFNITNNDSFEYERYKVVY